MKKIIYLCWIGACFTVFPGAFAQNARSLFSSGTGVTFESKVGDAKSVSGKPAEVKIAKEATDGKDYTGLSYSIYQEQENNKLAKVSPQKSFKTGDRIRVAVRANKNGYLSVVNISPEGKASIVSEQQANVSADVNVPEKGFLKFVGNKGVEQLVFVLSAKPLSQNTQGKPNMAAVVASACGSAKGSTRALVVDDTAGNEFNVVDINGSCAESKGTTRGLVVEVAQDSGYGVVPAASLIAGQMLTLRIKLRHE